jgi:hypothetical protein
MRRREFIAVLGGAAVCPLTGNAQQPKRMRRIGMLMPWAENEQLARTSVTAFGESAFPKRRWRQKKAGAEPVADTGEFAGGKPATERLCQAGLRE